MKGVMRASVSAGSSHRDASVTWSPQVIVPSGAAWSGTVHPRRSRARMASDRAMDELLDPVADRPGRLMDVILPGEGGCVIIREPRSLSTTQGVRGFEDGPRPLLLHLVGDDIVLDLLVGGAVEAPD